jgi:hypothetical protein
MKVPVQIMVGGRKIQIKYVESLEGNHSGEMEVGGALIRISKARHPKIDDVFTTLFHELIHVAFDITGHSVEWPDKKEEPLVYALENMLAGLFSFRAGPHIKYKEIDWD